MLVKRVQDMMDDGQGETIYEVGVDGKFLTIIFIQ